MQVTEHFDIIVIGAGAAGLVAAREFTRVKTKVLVVEGRDRIGGRMYTNIPQNFTSPIEQGAEFIHGEATCTFEILKEAQAEYVQIEGNTFQAYEHDVEKADFFDDDWKGILEKLETLDRDMTFAEFLSLKFSGDEYGMLREKITKFVEGYNAADITKVSSLALRQEWSEEEEPAQYRINGGYAKLYEFLAAEIESSSGIIKLNREVIKIVWRKDHVVVKTVSQTFSARKCLITIPVSLLGSGSIIFEPTIPEVHTAASKIGFGGVLKVTLEFMSSFWETHTPRKFKNLQFLFSDEKIPTWWSQIPFDKPILTGWLGGPAAEKLDQSDEAIFQSAVESLSKAMDYPVSKIREHLRAWHVDQWTNDKFSQGAYSYAMMGSADAVNFLQQPIEETLYFAGEALYSGPHRSTVEAALVSGRDVAKAILKN
jgi:monoamine oxidase